MSNEDNYHPDIPKGVHPFDKAHLTKSLNFLDRITGKKEKKEEEDNGNGSKEREEERQEKETNEEEGSR